MAGLVPAIHVFASQESKTWMPGIADKFTQSALSRLLWPGMTRRGRILTRRARASLPRVHAATGFGCREIASVIIDATMHSAPAAKNAGR